MSHLSKSSGHPCVNGSTSTLLGNTNYTDMEKSIALMWDTCADMEKALPLYDVTEVWVTQGTVGSCNWKNTH